MHLTLILISSFNPSANGKKASDAATLPLISSLKNSVAFWHAILLEANLLVWPAPMPSVLFFFAITIALDFTNLQTLNANIKSSNSLSVGLFLVTWDRLKDDYDKVLIDLNSQHKDYKPMMIKIYFNPIVD